MRVLRLSLILSFIDEYTCLENELNSCVFEVSVIMATFNPEWDKCVFTLNSIIKQKNINIELIIVDDGSSDNLFEHYKAYFVENHFADYKLIVQDKNRGTVKNYYDGLMTASGRFVKLISPGDALFNENTLAEWVKYLKVGGRKWSFAEAVYYTEVGDSVRIISRKAAPRIIDCYIKGNADVCRWNYVVLEDIPLGAALLCERCIFTNYLSEILDKVVYSEDLSYMLMMFDGIIPEYYQNPCIIYEFGRGVSTSGDKKWQKLFHNDLSSAEKLISHRTCDKDLQKKIRKALISMNSGNETRKRIIKNAQKGGVKKVLKFRLCPRMTSTDYSSIGNWWEEYVQSR